MKTPISYYGGKQNLLDELLPMIPPHTQYVEPFCGGASLFWAKPKSEHEVLNDYDERISNFWRVLQTDFERLQERIQQTLHHESNHSLSNKILKLPISDPLDYAWAFWANSQMSFSFRLFGGFAFGSDGRSGALTRRKREAFNSAFYDRIKDVEIFNRDAIDLILLKDTESSFMYLDPPYAESNCGHYEKGKGVYYKLLEIIPNLKCKWLLSSYPSDLLSELRLKHGWGYKDLTQNLSVSGKHNEGKTKTECLTYNYQIPQLKLFQ